MIKQCYLINCKDAQMEIEEKLLDLAATRFNIERKSLHPKDDIFKKLNINSLQAIDMLTEIELAFNIELPDYELKNVSTFQQLAEKIKCRL